MSGRHEQLPGHRVGPRWVVGLVSVLALVALVLGVDATQAGASAKTVKAQLTLTGVATSDSPVGGSVIGIHPGDSVSFATSSVPTAGLDKLGLGGLVGGLLNGVLGYQSVVDFSALPGGAKKTTLKSSPAKTFAFPKVGTYSFTWSVEKVTLLGAVPLNLDGNQLEKAGVKLNATNQYVGKVVVANDPPKGGISIQLPSVGAHPSVPVLGNLPSVGLPGVNAPTVSVPSVPNLDPGHGGGKATTSAAPPSSAKPSSSGLDLNYQPQGLTIPDRVVPHGDDGVGDAGSYGGGGAAGAYAGIIPTAGSVKAGSGASGATATDAARGSDPAATVQLASDSGDPSSQLPVILAILAILALALVAGTYARLFLLKHQD